MIPYLTEITPLEALLRLWISSRGVLVGILGNPHVFLCTKSLTCWQKKN